MKSLAIIIVALSLTGCASTQLAISSTTNEVIIKPPNSLYNCPTLNASDLPNPETLTNNQTAKVIERLYRGGKVCKINMNKIKAFIEKAEKNRLQSK